MASKDAKVDAFIGRATRWQEEMTQLRDVLLSCGLSEALKWGKPCYSHGDGNVAIIQPFKPHCAVMFFKGTLLDDPKEQLVIQGKNSQAAKRMEFTSPDEVKKKTRALKAFVKQAIEIEKAGLKVEFKQKHDLEYPEELTARFKKDAPLKKAFEALTPGRKRAWVMHFSDAKQSATRSARIEKAAPKVLAGKGPNDR